MNDYNNVIVWRAQLKQLKLKQPKYFAISQLACKKDV